MKGISSQESVIAGFQAIARDPHLMETSPVEAKKVMKAVTEIFVLTVDGGIRGKIRQDVRKYAATLSPLIPVDLLIRLENCSKESILLPSRSLLLASQSPYFDRLLQGPLNEAQTLREYYDSPDPSPAIPEISMKVKSLVGARKFFQVLSKVENHRKIPLSIEDRREFAYLVDLTDTFQLFWSCAEEILVPCLTPDLAQKLYAELLEAGKKKYQEVSKGKIDWEMVIPKIKGVIEKSLCKRVCFENADVFRELAVEHDLPILEQACLRIGLEGAVKAALETGGETQQLYLDWFLKQLPEQIKDRKQKPQTEFLQKFCQVAPLYRRVCHPALSQLSKKELLWLIKKLPSTLELLDLSDCVKIPSGKLKKFTNLEEKY